ncbi:MAG TPA: hypothetical protein VFY92_00570 [Hyphomicrobiaceae bacterium]|nr:hypothetical protein [Hyphomicrobiaceae bacterium]
MWKPLSPYAGRGLSGFLVSYLLLLLGVLMLVHVLQPAADGVAGSSSRSPVHQDRHGPAKQAAGAHDAPLLAPL